MSATDEDWANAIDQRGREINRLLAKVRRLKRIERAARALRVLMEDRDAAGETPFERRCRALWKALDAPVEVPAEGAKP